MRFDELTESMYSQSTYAKTKKPTGPKVQSTNDVYVDISEETENAVAITLKGRTALIPASRARKLAEKLNALAGQLLSEEDEIEEARKYSKNSKAGTDAKAKVKRERERDKKRLTNAKKEEVEEARDVFGRSISPARGKWKVISYLSPNRSHTINGDRSLLKVYKSEEEAIEYANYQNEKETGPKLYYVMKPDGEIIQPHSMNKLDEEDLDSDLGLENKPESHTKNDPPQTGNKGVSARQGMVG